MNIIPPFTGNDDLDSFTAEVVRALNALPIPPLYKKGTGEIVDVETTEVIGYQNRYLHVRFANDRIGTDFSPDYTGTTYYGLRNTTQPTTEEDHTLFSWNGPVDFTGNKLFYKNLGNRAVDFFIGDAAPDFRWTEFIFEDTEVDSTTETTTTVSDMEDTDTGSGTVVTTETTTEDEVGDGYSTEIETVITTTKDYTARTITVVTVATITTIRLYLGYIDLDDLQPLLGVGTDLLKEGSVTTSKLAEGAVTSTKLADRSVTEPKLADLAVSARTIQPGSVGTLKLANQAVSVPKIKATGVPSEDTFLRGDGVWAEVKSAGFSEQTIYDSDYYITEESFGGHMYHDPASTLDRVLSLDEAIEIGTTITVLDFYQETTIRVDVGNLLIVGPGTLSPAVKIGTYGKANLLKVENDLWSIDGYNLTAVTDPGAPYIRIITEDGARLLTELSEEIIRI